LNDRSVHCDNVKSNINYTKKFRSVLKRQIYGLIVTMFFKSKNNLTMHTSNCLFLKPSCYILLTQAITTVCSVLRSLWVFHKWRHQILANTQHPFPHLYVLSNKAVVLSSQNYWPPFRLRPLRHLWLTPYLAYFNQDKLINSVMQWKNGFKMHYTRILIKLCWHIRYLYVSIASHKQTW